jgi:hypothetical protein
VRQICQKNIAMIKSLVCLALLTLPLTSISQKKTKAAAAPDNSIIIPLKPENWIYKEGKAEFVEYKSRSCIKLLPESGQIILKDLNFTNGTIEFDMEPVDPRFISFYFRRTNEQESECFYFRAGRAGDTSAVDAVQYAPFLGGVNLWDLLFDYQGYADFKRDQWNHVKLVVSGKQMKAYVNNLVKPTLEVQQLEGNNTNGSFAFEGQVILSNLVITHNKVESLSPLPGVDLTNHDPRYLRKWEVSSPDTIPSGIDFSYTLIPNKDTKWEPIEAERRGLINLTRKFGASPKRRLVWLKTTISKEKAQSLRMELGFSDEIWVILNDGLVYLDKNWYTHPIRKYPDGRISLENGSCVLPLQAGNNVLLIGVANDFYGWGIMARLKAM